MSEKIKYSQGEIIITLKAIYDGDATFEANLDDEVKNILYVSANPVIPTDILEKKKLTVILDLIDEDEETLVARANIPVSLYDYSEPNYYLGMAGSAVTESGIGCGLVRIQIYPSALVAEYEKLS